MNTTKKTLIAVALAALGLSGSALAHPQHDKRSHGNHAERCHTMHDTTFDRRVDARQRQQHKRIVHGVRDGGITRGELRVLRKEQARIERLQDRFVADGRYTRVERQHLDGALDRAGRHIERATHNAVSQVHGRGRDHRDG